jgi:hypothetical protein
MPHKNLEARREYFRNYYEKHSEKLKERARLNRKPRKRRNLKNRFWCKSEDKALWDEIYTKWYRYVHNGRHPNYVRCKSAKERKERKDANRIKYRSKPEVRERINARNRKSNREKTRTKTSSYYTDLHTRLAMLLRCRIYRLLTRKGAHKSATTQRLLGCTYEFFVTYMESKFTEGMSWENQGKDGWEIDHDVACYRFDLTKPDHQKACFHFSNLKPCWEHVNVRKDSKRDKPILTDAEVTKMLESQAFLTRILPVPLPLAA